MDDNENTQQDDGRVRELPPPYNEQPERYKILKNNAIYDMETKRIAGAAGPVTTAITSDNSAAMRELWLAQTTEAVKRGIERGTEQDVWDVGVEIMAGAQAQIAADPSRGRASTYAYRTLLESAGLWAGGRVATENKLPDGSFALFSGDIAKDLVERLAEIRRQESE